MGHLVTEATIGREDDLGLDSSFGYSKWRAMIIKDNEGDWALCAAAWKGMKAGISFKSLFPVKLEVETGTRIVGKLTNEINLQFDFYSGVQGVPGRPGHKGVRGIPGSPGYFKMFYKNLRTGENESFTLPENPNGKNASEY